MMIAECKMGVLADFVILEFNLGVQPFSPHTEVNSAHPLEDIDRQRMGGSIFYPV